MIFALVTAVYSFQRRAIIDATISRNRIDAAEADGLAKGGLRIAEALLYVVRAKQLSSATGASDSAPTEDLSGDATTGAIDSLWQGIGQFPIRFEEDRSLKIEIEDEGAKLNLNALVPPDGSPARVGGLDDDTDDPDDADESGDDFSDGGSGSSAEDEAVEYLERVLDYIVEGMDAPAEEKNYDTAKIAENLLDFIDGDDRAINGRSEDEYYRRQDPPYSAWNRPFVSVDQIGLVEDVDPPLLRAMRHYITVHPIGSTTGINLNRAAPWVLKLVYSGSSGNRRLIGDKLARDIHKLRNNNKLVCDDVAADPRCISRSDVGNGELGNGSVYPEGNLPASPSVFRVVTTAQAGGLKRQFEAIYDTRPISGPQLLSWRRLRGSD